jgi:hypothetical protein
MTVVELKPMASSHSMHPLISEVNDTFLEVTRDNLVKAMKKEKRVVKKLC